MSVNILVLGNGFDLALGLPTKYTDFLEFVEDFQKLVDGCSPFVPGEGEFDSTRLIDVIDDSRYQERLRREYKNSNILEQIKSVPREEHELNRVLEDFWYCVRENSWIAYFTKRLKNKNGNWIDLEAEVRDVIQQLSSATYKFVRYPDPLKELSDKTPNIFGMLRKYDGLYNIMQQLDTPSEITVKEEAYLFFKAALRDDFRRFVCALEIYLDTFVRYWAKTSPRSLPKVINGLYSLRVLSFNYTDYYNVLKGQKMSEDNTCFVHGQLRYREKRKNNTMKQVVEASNVIIGFEDDDTKSEEMGLVYYKKYFQRITKGTGRAYLNWFNEYHINSNTKIRESEDTIKQLAARCPNHVYIFGHSMDPSDKEVFKDILLREPNDTQVTIYYHDEEAHERIIANLIAIIGKDRLIEKTHRHGIQDADIKIVPQSDDQS